MKTFPFGNLIHHEIWPTRPKKVIFSVEVYFLEANDDSRLRCLVLLKLKRREVFKGEFAWLTMLNCAEQEAESI